MTSLSFAAILTLLFFTCKKEVINDILDDSRARQTRQ
jgi:hypothetical protein